jgi:uncharacterized protein
LLLRKPAAALFPLIVRSENGVSPLTAILIDAHRNAHKGHKNPDPNGGLIASWNNSLAFVIESLERLGLGDVEVMIEFPMPGMNGEADVVLAGERPGTRELSYVVIELKQWKKAVVNRDNPVAVDAGYPQWKLHPVRQVQRYCEYLIQHLAPLHGRPDLIAGAALLHNARSEVDGLFALPTSAHGRLYTADRMDLFQRFLANRLAPVSGSRAADVLCSADEYEPPSSSEAFSRVGDPHPVFALQQEQEIAFQEVHEALIRARDGKRKKVMIVQGGPGSGKTALAVELLRTLKQEGRQVVHASGSQAFTQNLRRAAVQQRPKGVRYKDAESQAKQDYRFFQQFGALPENSLQVLICDEAHRVRARSRGRDVPSWVYQRGWCQADELISVAEVPVFLLDDWQSLGPDEVGSTDYLVERALALGCEPVVTELPGMYRAGGSARFRDWVTQLLGLKSTSQQTWEADGRIDVRVAESPQELEAFLEARMREEDATARMTAGFCWEWQAPHDGLRLEVQIGDWHRPWNARSPASGADIPPTTQWATDSRGFGQVGCIYTAQNFEFDWAGVILGPDMVWNGERFVVDRMKTRDDRLTGKSVSDEQVDRLVRNAYHVLLTRGRRGVVVYSEDAKTQNRLRELITNTVAAQPIRKKKRRVPARREPASTDQLAIEFE